MSGKDLFRFFNEVKVGDMVRVKLNKKSCFIAGVEYGEYTDAYMTRKLCEIGERQFNFRGEYTGKTNWTKPISREEFFEKYADTDQKQYVYSMEFGLDFVQKERKALISVLDIEDIEIEIPKKAFKYIDMAYDYANLNSDCDDCIEIAINKYKVLRELNSKIHDTVYNMISSRLGFTN